MEHRVGRGLCMARAGEGTGAGLQTALVSAPFPAVLARHTAGKLLVHRTRTVYTT